MVKLPALKGRQVLKFLLKAGFYIHHRTGSHARLFHEKYTHLRVTIPVHNKTLPDKTLRSILKQANIEESEFLRLLKE